MFWLIGAAVIYFGIGLLLAWSFQSAGGQKFKLNKKSLPFILTWPSLFLK